MTKFDLAKELAVSEKLHLSTAVQAVDGIIRILKESFAKGENLYLRGFASFNVVEVPEKKGYIFHSGSQVVIPPHRSLRLKPSKELHELLNNEDLTNIKNSDTDNYEL